MTIINTQIKGQGGVQPVGTLGINANGVYDVSSYANADVQVPTTAPAYYVEKRNIGNNTLGNSTNIINLNGIKNLYQGVLAYEYYSVSFPANTNADLSALETIKSDYACYGMFKGSNLVSADLSNVNEIGLGSSCANMFDSCNNLTSVDLSSLTTISGQYSCKEMFNNCSRDINIDLSSLTTVSGQYACQNMFQRCGITNIDLSSLTTVSGERGCSSMFPYAYLTSVDLSNLTTISGSYGCSAMFQNCTRLTSADLSGLTTLDKQGVCQYMFSGCTSLTTVDLSNLTLVSGSGACYAMFQSCTNLKNIFLPKIQSSNYSSRPSNSPLMAFQSSGLEVFDARNIITVGDYGIFDNMLNGTPYLKTINLNSLEHIGKEAARAFLFNNTNTNTLENLYFPMLTSFGSNPFYTNAFTGRTNLTIHFRKDMQATVEALPNYATLWGAGTGSSVVFDLAGTLTGADNNSYARSEKDSVYASETAGAAKTATAWSYNNTIYYTSGGAEPSVGDTIYSDSACTTAVTTISSIA